MVLAALLALGGWAGAAAQERTLLPVDGAAAQPDFFSFRAQLLAALARRDVEALLAAVHPSIKNSFGGNDGIDAFREAWRLGQPDSALWETLTGTLALGGSFTENGNFVAPYVFSRWPEGIDAFEHVAIIGSEVRVRAAPLATSPVLGALSFAIVPAVVQRQAGEGWQPVRLADGTIGHVSKRLARSPIDYRAIFANSEGRWQLVTFLAGD